MIRRRDETTMKILVHSFCPSEYSYSVFLLRNSLILRCAKIEIDPLRNINYEIWKSYPPLS